MNEANDDLAIGAMFQRLVAASRRATAAMDSIGRAWNEGIRREFEAHPDVQEAVAQMRGFYET